MSNFEIFATARFTVAEMTSTDRLKSPVMAHFDSSNINPNYYTIMTNRQTDKVAVAYIVFYNSVACHVIHVLILVSSRAAKFGVSYYVITASIVLM